MLSLRIAIVLFLTSAFERVACASVASSLYQQQTPASIRSRVDRRREDGSSAPSTSPPATLSLPPPLPGQDIGDYFDTIDGILNKTSDEIPASDGSKPQLSERNLVRSSDFLKSTWYDGTEHYNISISKCVQFTSIIGKWTSLDGVTTENATFNDMNDDLRTHFISTTNLSEHLTSRLLDNANAANSEAEAFLASTICDYTQPGVHDELRRLQTTDTVHNLHTKFMAMDGYWTNVLISMGAGAAVGGSLYKGFYNRNATAHNVAITSFVAAGLIFTRGVVERLYMNGMLQYMEASVIGAFTSWFRQALALGLALQQQYLRQVGSDQQDSGCLEEIVVVGGTDGLQTVSEPGAGIIELVPMGRCYQY